MRATPAATLTTLVTIDFFSCTSVEHDDQHLVYDLDHADIS
jgi:hypothetical protein